MIWGDINDIFGETSIFNNSFSYKDILISNPLNLLNIYSRIYFGSKKIQRFRRRRGAPGSPSSGDDQSLPSRLLQRLDREDEAV